jgi:hypothetical protein
MTIAVVGRHLHKVQALVATANVRASIFNSPIVFTGFVLNQIDTGSLVTLFSGHTPHAVLIAASLQSPWELGSARTRWTNLIGHLGFGLTLSLQLHIASEVSRAFEGTDSIVVNACYPDAVNFVLNRLGHAVHCGIGNAAIVEAIARFTFSLKENDQIAVVCHHGHLAAWMAQRSEVPVPRIWVNSREVEMFDYGYGPLGHELNRITGCTAAKLLSGILGSQRVSMSVPGIAGMRGGLPVHIEGSTVTIAPPSGVTLAEIEAFNQMGETLDGISLKDDGVEYSLEARATLQGLGFEFFNGFKFADLEFACSEMIAKRDVLSRYPQ